MGLSFSEGLAEGESWGAGLDVRGALSWPALVPSMGRVQRSSNYADDLARSVAVSTWRQILSWR